MMTDFLETFFFLVWLSSIVLNWKKNTWAAFASTFWLSNKMHDERLKVWGSSVGKKHFVVVCLVESLPSSSLNSWGWAWMYDPPAWCTSQVLGLQACFSIPSLRTKCVFYFPVWFDCETWEDFLFWFFVCFCLFGLVWFGFSCDMS